MINTFGQDVQQVSPPGDQHPVQALAPALKIPLSAIAFALGAPT
jgi:hypothetical protein